MLEGRSNPIIHLLNKQMNRIINGSIIGTPCAKELKPLVYEFFVKLIESPIKWNEENQIWWNRVSGIGDAVQYLCINTERYSVGKKDVEPFKKLFNELEQLRDEVLKAYSQGRDDNEINTKIDVIAEIICKNTVNTVSNGGNVRGRTGMMFENYENLWKVIHRINNEWDDLRARGFNLQVFYDFYESLSYMRWIDAEQSDEEKLNSFMGILDGTKKFVLVYEHKPVCYKVAELNGEDREVVEMPIMHYMKPYQMDPKEDK